MRLNEIESYQNLNDDIQSIIQKYEPILKEYYYSDIMIFRGMKDTSPIILGDGNNMNRKSANTQNFYTLILDNSPEWKDYPKRSKSFICSLSKNNASGYGVPFVAIPLENQPIGVCPEEDFWFSFGSPSPNTINGDIDYLNHTCRIIDSSCPKLTKNNTYDEFKTIISRMDEIVIKNLETFMKDSNDYRALNSLGYFNKPNLLELLMNHYDPTEHDFIVVDNYKSLDESFENEVWFSGKVLFINYDIWSTISRYLIKKEK